MAGDTDRPKTVVLIPTYNEADNIYELAKKARVFGDVLVLDSSPNRDTEREACRAGAKVITFPVCVEIAGKLSAGLTHAVKHDYEWAITVDAGGSHEVGEVLPDVHYDAVLGTRFTGGSVSNRKWSRYLISYLAAAVFNALWSTKFPDVTSGHRAFSVEFLKRFNISDYRSSHFDFHTETASKLMAHNARIKEVPISYTYGTSTFRPKYLFWALVWLAYWRIKSFFL